MPTTTSTLVLVIDRPPDAVYEALTSLGRLKGLIETSGTYRGTVDISDDPIRVGSTYVDRTPLGRLHGTVLELEPGRRVVFRQATASGDLDIQITYALEPATTGTRLVRTGEITTRRWLGAVHPVVVWATRAENRRTMEALKASLEDG